MIPCRILQPKKVNAPEAAIWVKKNGNHICLAKAVAPTMDKYASFVGDKLPPICDLINHLTALCKETRAAIVAFHDGNDKEIHYHQMLHAFLRRHERILDSICRLVTLGRAEHAGALTRIAYEAFLNFYIDWLSPEFFWTSTSTFISYPGTAERHQK